ncbi:translation initiation factor 2 [bacterium D16-76]|nr:translation initiation factor 2 [bacterium D16-76]
MPATRNLCAQLPLDLHQRVCEAREESGLTTAQYITNLLMEYYEMKENGGKVTMATNTRTMAFQIGEDLFQRIKAHLERETARTGRKLTQREFVLGLIEEALNEAERQAGVNPCEAPQDGSDPQPQDEPNPAPLGEEKAG